MSGCHTERCQAIRKFVETLMANKTGISWSVFDEESSDSVIARLYLANKSETLHLPDLGGDLATALDDSTKQAITSWLQPYF